MIVPSDGREGIGMERGVRGERVLIPVLLHVPSDYELPIQSYLSELQYNQNAIKGDTQI